MESCAEKNFHCRRGGGSSLCVSSLSFQVPRPTRGIGQLAKGIKLPLPKQRSQCVTKGKVNQIVELAAAGL